MSLDLTNTEPMYVLGRLWAICEAAIKEDHSLVSGTILHQLGVDPLQGFGLLHMKFMQHLRNLPHDRREHWSGLVGNVVELLPGAAIPSGPQSPENQGLMHLGYLQQRFALPV